MELYYRSKVRKQKVRAFTEDENLKRKIILRFLLGLYVRKQVCLIGIYQNIGISMCMIIDTSGKWKRIQIYGYENAENIENI